MNIISVMLFITSVSTFCWLNDISSIYSSEQWFSIHEQWAAHSDRSYIPDLPRYGLPEHILTFFKKDLGAYGYYDTLVSVVLDDVPSIGQLVDYYSDIPSTRLETEKYIYVTTNGRIEVFFSVGNTSSKDRTCVKIFNKSGRLLTDPIYLSYGHMGDV